MIEFLTKGRLFPGSIGRTEAAGLFLLFPLFFAVAPHSGAGEAASGDWFVLTGDKEVPNGAWTWFVGERVIVDPDAADGPRILVGSVSAGEDTAGNIAVLWYDVENGKSGHFVLHEGLEQDDHNNPGLLIRPDGRYLAVYTKHATDNLTRWRISENPHDPTSWKPEQTFDLGTDVTYSNLYHLPRDRDGKGRTYNFVRSHNFDPNILVSEDHGVSWSWRGLLVKEGEGRTDRPYPRYATDGEAIHFIITDGHPRRWPTNGIYHGYVRDGTLYNSFGEVMKDNLLDHRMEAPRPSDLTTVYEVGTKFDGEAMGRAWTVDLVMDGAYPVAVFSARANDDWSDHRFFYARFDGAEWQVNQLAKAGAGLYDREQDYTGLASLDPSDPSRVFISTPIDPRDGSELRFHEIFAGTTPDNGGSWEWTALTPDAKADNLRPLVPTWEGGRTALLWFSGAYTTYRDWNAAVVGAIDPVARKLRYDGPPEAHRPE